LSTAQSPSWKAYSALGAVCFFWGTTYLAIRIALETIPPLFLVALRFSISGAILLLAAKLSGAHLPRGRKLLLTAFNGVLILGIGNGCLVIAELWIPSSLAALFIAISPFWMVGLEALIPGGARLMWTTAVGMLIGFLGASLLVGPSLLHEGMGGHIWNGFLILQLGSASWSLGSILQKRSVSEVHPVVNGAVQQLAAGLAFVIPALLTGRTPEKWTAEGAGSILYLVVFGSLVGYSAYIYALERLPVAIVSIYTYINPIVAAILGWWFYREPFGRTEILAMAIIFTGVGLVKSPGSASPFRVPWLPTRRRSSSGS
jgi:drug/metabolite transporter (DMT)-like permease